MADPFVFTFFSSISGRDARRIRTTWAEFVAGLERAKPQAVKEAAPLIGIYTLGDARTAKGSLRHDDNVRTVTGATLDYDAGAVTPDEARRRLEEHGIRAVVVTTFSHTPGHPKWRVIAPFACPLAPSEHRRWTAVLNGAVGGIAAPESFSLSRAYYIGGRVGHEYQVLTTAGQYLTDLEAPDAIAVYPPDRSIHAAVVTPYVHAPAAPRGGRYVAAAIESECLALAGTPPGARNEALNRAAFKLARFVAAGEADAGPIAEALSIAAQSAGLPEWEVRRTIESAFSAREVAA